MRSVLHVSLNAPGGYSNLGIMNGFLANGFDSYQSFDFQLHTYNSDKDNMRGMLIAEAEKMEPDIIFMQIQGSDILDIETFRMLSKIAFTVNFTFDIREVEQTEWLYNLAPVLGLICFSNQRDVDECIKRGYHNVMCLQSSVDMDVYSNIPASATNVDAFLFTKHTNRGTVSFIGNNFYRTNWKFPLSEEREEMVGRLRNKLGSRFQVYGMGWDGSFITKPEEEIEIYKKNLIGINHNNFKAEGYSSDRLWRIMACGAMCLTSYFPGIEKIFTRGVHLDWWNSLDELEEKIEYYLNRLEETRMIAQQGTAYVREHHTWTRRIEEMMQHVKRLRPEKKSENCLKMGAHVVDGIIPQAFDEQFKDIVCDCGSLVFRWSECGCENKVYQLRAEQNV